MQHRETVLLGLRTAGHCTAPVQRALGKASTARAGPKEEDSYSSTELLTWPSKKGLTASSVTSKCF
jgi:hypothetical protein